ncbi:Uncharacterized protein TCM_006165 [Theobroma cacao]|uniref:Uncharacterized protein n=1 Tax=Theobroma cacao TaxID=3641 RepID=A0A061DY86_THECC|nr:Uncharacterized protein TCM_006165 [Theobroma cacao]
MWREFTFVPASRRTSALHTERRSKVVQAMANGHGSAINIKKEEKKNNQRPISRCCCFILFSYTDPLRTTSHLAALLGRCDL